MEAALSARGVGAGAGAFVPKTVVVLGVGLQSGERDFDRVVELRMRDIHGEEGWRRGCGVISRTGAILHKGLLIRAGDHVQRHAGVRGQAEEFCAFDRRVCQCGTHRVGVAA